MDILRVDETNPASMSRLKLFIANALSLNRALALASLMYENKHIADGKSAPVVKCGGAVYVSLGCILETDEHPAKYAQMYSFDAVSENVIMASYLGLL